MRRASLSRLIVFALAGAAGAMPARGEAHSALEKFLHRDVDVLTVTDVTPAGRAYAPATPARPVRYKLIYFGYMDFNGTRTWAGEKIPPNRDVLQWMLEAMRVQGYVVADETHPPEQVLVFSWGMMAGGTARPALGFLGGDKVNLMWEQVQYGGMVDSRVLTRGIQRTGIAGKVWDLAESNLFIGVVRSYAVDGFETDHLTQLWETRFACPSTGLTMTRAMPLMVRAAALNLGRETARPVSLNASAVFEGRVELGELKVLGTAEETEAASAPGEAPKK